MTKKGKSAAAIARKEARRHFGQKLPPGVPKPPVQQPPAKLTKASSVAATAAAAALAKYRGGGASSCSSTTAAASSATTAGAGASARPRPRCPYAAHQRILLLGDGDFSFAAALGLLWSEAGALVATGFDSEAAARSKYAALNENLATLRNLGGEVLFGVDATAVHAHGALRGRSFDRIVFNFPHAGAGIKDQSRNVATNQSLLRGTFASASQLLAEGGELHVTLKRGQPYDSWEAVAIAKMCGLGVKGCSPFQPAAFPGYAHRRTIGDEHAGVDAHANAEIGAASSKTYAFAPREALEEAKAERQALKGEGGGGGGKGRQVGKQGAKRGGGRI